MRLSSWSQDKEVRGATSFTAGSTSLEMLDHNLVLGTKLRFWKRCSTRSEESGGSHELSMEKNTKHFVKKSLIDSVNQRSLDSNSNLRHETVWNRVSQTVLLQDRLWYTNAFQIPSNMNSLNFDLSHWGCLASLVPSQQKRQTFLKSQENPGPT